MCLTGLRKRLVEQQAKGVTVGSDAGGAEIAAGIDITERSLRTFLVRGALPGKEGCRGGPGHGVGRRQVIRSEPIEGGGAERRTGETAMRRSKNGEPSFRFAGYGGSIFRGDL